MDQTWIQCILLFVKWNISCIQQNEFIYHVKVKRNGWINWKYWKWFKLYKMFQYGYELIVFFRLIILSFWMTNDYSPEYVLHWDPFFGSLMFVYTFFDFYTTIAMMPVLWFMFGIDYIYYFKTNKHIITLVYEFSIKNHEDFIQLNNNQSQNRLFSVFIKNFPPLEMIWIIWNFRKKEYLLKFNQKQNTFLFLSNRIRTRLIIFNCLFEIMANLVLSFACKLSICFVYNQ